MRFIIAAVLAFAATASRADTLAQQLAGMTVGTWRPVATANTFASIDPNATNPPNYNRPGPSPWVQTGQRNLLEAWNSGGYDAASNRLIYWGGGHWDYWGNEVVALDLATLQWQRLSDPYVPNPPGPYVWPLAGGTFANNTPAPPHTYDTMAVCDGKLVTLVAMEQPAVNSAKNGFIFDLTSRTWSGPFPNAGAIEGSSACDPSRHVVWFMPRNVNPGSLTYGQFASMNVSSGVVTNYGAPSSDAYIGKIGSMMGYDPVADRVVIMSLAGPAPYKMAERDPGNPSAPWVVATQVGQPAAVRGANAMAWSAARGAWIVWMDILNNAAVYEVKRTSAAPLTYTWTLLTAATNSVVPIAVNHNGSYDKFQVVTVDGAEYLLGIMRAADGVFAFKVSDATGPPPPPPPGPTCTPLEYSGLPMCSAAVEAPKPLPCDAPGVFVCEDFTALRTGKLYTGVSMPRLEGGDLVLTLPAQSSANAGGEARWTFKPIGEGGFLAFAYRIKADAGALALSGRKEFILWRGASSCTDLELSQTHYYWRPIAVPYTSCGGGSFALQTGPYDWLVQYPDYRCASRDMGADRYDQCAVTRADVWKDIYAEVTLGHYGQPDSHVVMWHREGGQPWRRYLDRDGWAFHGAGGFDHFALTAYMTGKNAAQENAPGQVRYGHLVISTQPFMATL